MNAPIERHLSTQPVRYLPGELHPRLTHFNRRRLLPAFPSLPWRTELADELEMRYEEGQFIEDERAAVAPRAAQAPHEPDAFMRWFEGLAEDGPGQGDALFRWLADDASLGAMRWFLTQEVAGEAGFDDLLALTQLRMPLRPKLEMARNYWDEMGRGEFDRKNLIAVLENEILPLYYKKRKKWLAVVKNSMKEVVTFFDSDRMADEYYKKLYKVGAKKLELV